MEATIFAGETEQFAMSELKRNLPRFASLLETSVDDLKIMTYHWFPSSYMKSERRDPVIKSEGMLEDMPLVQKRRMQGKSVAGWGTFLHRSFLNPEIHYVLYSIRGQDDADETYLICKKGDLYLLKRYAYKLNQICNEVKEAPILADGLMEEIIQNSIGFLLRAKQIEKYGVKIKRGIILDGPPGNGKTMACRYIQKMCVQHGISWNTLTSADIDQAYNEKNLTELFQQYTVTFFDDIDISYMDRSKGAAKMACSLLTAMDGMSDSGHLVRIFTTNESVDQLDKAFIRPGRIDKCITFELPDEKLRRRLVDSWPKEIVENIDVEEIIDRSHDFSFAELEAIRTFLVTNKILGDETWDLKKAFGEFFQRRPENKKRKRMGY